MNKSKRVSLKLSNYFYINVHHLYFSNSPVKEKALTLGNNLPPFLISNSFCLGIKHPQLHNSTTPMVGLNGNFVKKLSVTN